MLLFIFIASFYTCCAHFMYSFLCDVFPPESRNMNDGPADWLIFLLSFVWPFTVSVIIYVAVFKLKKNTGD